ncbi:diguanylate cyclase domain-containing protein [Comamonas odontotermitis]|uniref:diguanylate cyclase domain-containing protein n=1 Tax=Comamonas odontotermitis TaxID=379895 RepID=UPI0037502DA6
MSSPVARSFAAPLQEPVAARGPAASRWRARSLRTYLIVMMLAAALPVLIASIYTVQHVARSYRDNSLRHMLDTTKNLGHIIESDLASRAAMLQAYAANAQSEDAEALARWLTLTDMGSDSTLFVTTASTASPILVSAHSSIKGYVPPGLVQQALEGKTPVFSQLFFHDDKPRIAIAVRMQKDSGKVMMLTTTPQNLVSAAQDTSDEGALIAVTDGNGRMLARSVQPERYIGTPVPDWKKLKEVGASSGTFEAERADKGSVIFAFHEIKGTPGWVIVAGESLGAFNARWQKPMFNIALVGTLALTVAVLLSTWVSRQLLRPIRQLTDASRTGSAYEMPVTDDSQVLMVKEYESLRQSLANARAQLESALGHQRQIAHALSVSEQRSRTLAHAGAAVLWTLDAQGRATSMVGWEVLAGTPDDTALGFGWLRRIHPADVADLRRQAPDLLADSEHALDVEFRLRTHDGQWRWMRARGAAILGPGRNIHEWLGVLEDVDDRKRAQAAVAYLAHHDPLTGLPNRSLLQTHIHSVGSARAYGALLYLDLDRFKQVNDTLGHAAGDALLCSVAERLRGLLRDTDLVVRLGGDEFCIVQKASSPHAAASLAQRVIDVLSADYFLEGRRVNIGASVGITMHLGQTQTLDPDRLLREADIALYEAKKQGRGRYVFYTPELSA